MNATGRFARPSSRSGGLVLAWGLLAAGIPAACRPPASFEPSPGAAVADAAGPIEVEQPPAPDVVPDEDGAPPPPPSGPGLEARYADPAFFGEPSAVEPCAAEQERPAVRITEDGLLEATGFPAVSADGDRLAVFRSVTDLAATETSWLELRGTARGELLERSSLLEAADDPEGEWPAAGSSAFRRLERRVERAQRQLARDGFRTLAPLAVPAAADRCGPVVAVGEGAEGRRRIVVREAGPGAVLWQFEAEGSLGVPGCGPDGGAAMLSRVDGWFDPTGELLVVERLYVSGPDWCDDVREVDVGRRVPPAR